MRLIYLFLLLSISFEVAAQQAIEYFDKQWQVTTKADAAFYRKITYNPKGKPDGIVKDYLITGELLFNGRLSSLNPETLEGLCTWYYKNGQKHQEGYYINGKLKGKLSVWTMSGKEEGVLDNSGYFFSENYFSKHWKNLETELGVKLSMDTNTIHLLTRVGDHFFKKEGDYENGLTLFYLSHDLAKKLDRETNIATSFNNIGIGFHTLGLLEESLSFFQKALAIETRLNLKKKLATTYNNIGAVYNTKGFYKETLNWYKKSIEIRRALNLEADIATNYNNIGAVYDAQGLFTEAIEWYQKAIRIHEKLGETAKLAATYNNIGVVYSSRKLPIKALEFFQKAETIYTSLNRSENLATTYNNIGFVYNTQGLYEDALTYFTNAANIYYGLAINVKLAPTYTNIGAVYHNKKHFNTAIEWYQKAIDIQRRLDLKVDLAASYNNLGRVYKDIKLPERAIKYYKEALKIHEYLENNMEASISYGNIANLYFETARFDTALYYAQKNILGNEYHRTKNRSHDIRQLFTNRSLNALEIGIYSAHISGKSDTLAFHLVERAKARSLVELLAEKPLKEFDIPEEFKLKLASISNQLKAMNLELAKDIAPAKRKHLINIRNQLFFEQKELENQIRYEIPAFASIVYPKPIRYSEVQKKLHKEEVLVSYYCGSLWSYAFIISQDQIKVVDLGETTQLIELVNSFQSNYLHPQKEVISQKKDFLKSIQLKKVFHQHAYSLYKTLWQPIESIGLLAGKKVVLVPDGILHYLPFELMVRDSTQKSYDEYDYLIKNHDFNYSPSATVLHFERSQPQNTFKAKDFFGIGLQDFNENYCFEDTIILNPLPTAISEVKSIAQLFPENSRQTLVYNSASEAQFKKANLKDYRYIHISTHGVINLNNPQFSRILLHPTKEEQDGCLNLYEMFDLKLNADLVTLSACKTGLGKLERGEGMIGFTRGLMYAGASSIILSLWEVADKSTSELFINYYKKLQHKKGVNKYQPLRETQLQMIKNGKEYANPYYWAPFVFVGKR